MMYLFALAIFFLLYALLAHRDFLLALKLMVFLLPAYLIRFSIGPLPSTALEGMFLIIFLLWGRNLFKEKRLATGLHEVRHSLYFWPGLLLIAAAGLSVFWATDAKSALGIWKAYFLEPAIFYAILITSVRSREEWKGLLRWLGAAVLVFTALALVQRITGWWSPEWAWTVPDNRRVTGLYTSPNALGLFVGPIATAMFAWMLIKKEVSKRTLVYVVSVFAAGLLCILLAVSRGALAAVCATVFLLLWSLWSKKKAIVLALVAVCLLIVMPISRAHLMELATFQVDSGQSRAALYKGSLELLQEAPITGLGLASFADHFESVRPESFSERLIYPHSFFLNFWAETGLLGLCAVIWMMISTIWSTRKQADSRDRWVFTAGLLVIFLHGLIDVSYFKNDLAMLTWFFLAGFASQGSVNGEAVE